MVCFDRKLTIYTCAFSLLHMETNRKKNQRRKEKWKCGNYANTCNEPMQILIWYCTILISRPWKITSTQGMKNQISYIEK